MPEDGFTKRDWQLFRERLPAWQEAYMDRLNREYIELPREDALPSDKFWQLAKRIQEDRRKAGVHLEIRRSGFFYALILLLDEGAIQMDDLNDFSDEVGKALYRKMYHFFSMQPGHLVGTWRRFGAQGVLCVNEIAETGFRRRSDLRKHSKKPDSTFLLRKKRRWC